MNKRGAYFFMIDAMVASAVIVATLYLIFSSYQAVPQANPTLRTLNDYINFLTLTTVREYPGDVMVDAINNKNITDIDNSILDQLMEWYYYNSSYWRINDTVINVTRGIVSQDRSMLVYLNGTLLYNRTLRSMADADLMIDNKRVVFKRISDLIIFGPVILEVKVWA